MTEILGGSQRTSCSWWNFKIRVTCMAMFWTHQDLDNFRTGSRQHIESIFQIRWQAIVQTNVNIIIIWWTVTYNGITWQWRKIALYDSYIQVEQFSLLATAKLIYWTSAWKVMNADHWILSKHWHALSLWEHLLEIWYLVWQISALFIILYCLGVYKVASYISFITSWVIHGLDHC